MSRRPKKRCAVCGQDIVPDPLVDPGNPPHRHQACTTAHPTRAHHRMVTLAKSSPSRSTPRPSQNENATVMLRIRASWRSRRAHHALRFRGQGKQYPSYQTGIEVEPRKHRWSIYRPRWPGLVVCFWLSLLILTRRLSAGNQTPRQRTGNTKADAMSRRLVQYVLAGQTRSRPCSVSNPRASIRDVTIRKFAQKPFRRNGELME